MESAEEFFTNKTNIICLSLGAAAMCILCCAYKCLCK